MMAKGFDSDRAFMIVEVAGDHLYFQAISRADRTVDDGIIARTSAVSQPESGAAGEAAAR